MGKGRKPKPPALRLLDGRRSRWLGETKDMGHGIAPGVPVAPAHLDEIARAHWDYLVEHLSPCQLLEMVDAGSLEKLCEAYSVGVRAKQECGTLTVMDDNGKVTKNPAISVWNDATSLYLRYCVEFGLTPSSRAKVHPKSKPEADPFAEFQKKA